MVRVVYADKTAHTAVRVAVKAVAVAALRATLHCVAKVPLFIDTLHLNNEDPSALRVDGSGFPKASARIDDERLITGAQGQSYKPLDMVMPARSRASCIVWRAGKLRIEPEPPGNFKGSLLKYLLDVVRTSITPRHPILTCRISGEVDRDAPGRYQADITIFEVAASRICTTRGITILVKLWISKYPLLPA